MMMPSRTDNTIASLNHLKELAEEKNAEDKLGAFAAGTLIVILSACISCAAYSLTLKRWPGQLRQWIKNNDLKDKYNYKGEKEKSDEEKQKDFMDRILDILELIPIGGGVAVGGVVIIRIRRKAGRQRHMEECMEEEMDRLKESLEKEAEAISAGGVTDNKPSMLSGQTIVQMFNSFAGLMGLKNEEFQRAKDETALEYFLRIAKSVKFPEEDSIKASRYFDDELYAKKLSTNEDKACFMKLLLAMLNTIDTKSKKAQKAAA